MIPFDEIDERLKALGKTRAWLAEQAGRSEGSVRAALAPRAKPKNRSKHLQRILTSVIEAEEAKAIEESASRVPPGYSAIFFSDEELDLADRASRIAQAPSLAQFCHDVIQAEARRLIELDERGKRDIA